MTINNFKEQEEGAFTFMNNGLLKGKVVLSYFKNSDLTIMAFPSINVGFTKNIINLIASCGKLGKYFLCDIHSHHSGIITGMAKDLNLTVLATRHYSSSNGSEMCIMVLERTDEFDKLEKTFEIPSIINPYLQPVNVSAYPVSYKSLGNITCNCQVTFISYKDEASDDEIISMVRKQRDTGTGVVALFTNRQLNKQPGYVFRAQFAIHDTLWFNLIS